jgi:hypothetical protein
MKNFIDKIKKTIIFPFKAIWNIFCNVWNWLNKNSSQITVIVLSLTLIFAIRIGHSQIQIASKQNDINQNLLNLDYTPSIVVTYVEPNRNKSNLDIESHFGRWQILNVGKGNIFIKYVFLDFSSDKSLVPVYLQDKEFMMGSGKFIASSGSDYFWADSAFTYIEQFKSKVPNGGSYIPLEIDLQNGDGKKYVAKGVFVIRTYNGVVQTSVDIISILPSSY